MALIAPMVSSKSNEWATPQSLFDYLDKQYKFTLDPCATKENAKCSKFYTQEDDGLFKSWAGESVFVNPPYGGHTRKWIEKSISEVRGKKLFSEMAVWVVMLIVSSTDRSYWHDLIDKEAHEILFMRGRVKFNDVKSTAPFASAIVVFRPHYFRDFGNKRTVKFIDIREYHQ